MTRKQRRASMIGIILGVVAVAVGLILWAAPQATMFYLIPSKVVEEKMQVGKRFRLGGFLAKGSLQRGEGTKVDFAVTDSIHTIKVSFDGILPGLIGEGKGVVAEGSLAANGVFQADIVLAKHDENYMPRQVVDALKEKGIGPEGAKKMPDGYSHPTN